MMHANMTTILYGTPLSLYTGKARSYLIKAGLPYREVTGADPHYQNHVREIAGTGSVPAVELQDGTVIRDGTRIIDHFEALSGYGFSPATPKQRIVSRLFDVIGAEGLLRPAMHYRWDFPELNADFVSYHFETMVPPEKDRKRLAAKTMDRMRGAGQLFGATPENFPLIESLYEELLVHLNAHFSAHPYLLGSRPCIGDFGLMAPLYAHLGRDPKPLQLMQASAIRLFRWVERMNRPEADIGEFDGLAPDEYIPGDRIPDTLIDLMAHLAIDFVPETTAAAQCINVWLETQDPPPGTHVQRGVDMGVFELRGATVKALAQPYRFFLLKRVQDVYAALDGSDREDVDALLTRTGMAPLLGLTLSRQIEWKDNREVWV